MAKSATSVTGLANGAQLEFSLSVLLGVWVLLLICSHRVFLAHLENAAILHQFFNECPFVFKIVNHVVLEIEEESKSILKYSFKKVARGWLVKLCV